MSTKRYIDGTEQGDGDGDGDGKAPVEVACPLIGEKPATENVLSELRLLNVKVAELTTAIVGAERLGHRGIITRLNAVERAVLIFAGGLILIGGERIVKLFF